MGKRASRSDLRRIEESIDEVIRNNKKRRDDVEMQEVVGSSEPEQQLKLQIQKQLIVRAHEERKAISRNDPIKVARGQRICQLFHQHPILAHHAQSRSQENNAVRKGIWETIALQITLEFPVLGPCTVADAKKLVDYYKGRCPVSRISSPSSSRDSSEEEDGEWIRSIQQKTPPTWSTEEQFEKMLEEGRSERLRFLIKCTKEFMRQSGLGNTTKSRMTVLNESRLKMWEKITHVVNWKFEKWAIEPLVVDQVKKSFSNWKRRHPGEFIRSQSSSTSEESEDVEPQKKKLRQQMAVTQEILKIINPFGI